MARAYNIAYLEDAMSAVGAMMDYSVNSCGEELESFYTRFIGSGVANLLFRANPKILSGSSGIELAMQVADRTGKPLPEAECLIDMGSPEYWTGWTLAYLSWYLNMDFRAMQERGVGAAEIFGRYSTLHEADLTKSVSYARKLMEEKLAQHNPLKTARKNAGLTQKELAEASGVSLRAIRAYEQGQLSLRNAESIAVFRLSRVLACPIDYLI